MDLNKRLRRSGLIATIVCSAISVAIVSASIFIGSSLAGFWLSEIDAAEYQDIRAVFFSQQAGDDRLGADEIRTNMRITNIVFGANVLMILWLIWSPFRGFLLFNLRRPVLNVLWLRKFHSDPQHSKFWISDAIEDSRLQYYRTITLADQQFHFSESNLKHGRIKNLLGVLIFAYIFIAFSCLSLFLVRINAILGIIAMGTTWLMLILLFIFARRVRQREKTNRERALNIDIEPMPLNEINDHFESASPSDRVLVYRARDEEWQELVKSFIIKSDIVLIDISNLSDNMRWELKQAVSLKGPDRIILLSDTPFGSKEALIDFVPDFAKKLYQSAQALTHVGFPWVANADSFLLEAGGRAMAAAVRLRSDHDGGLLRRLARASKDAGQTRRLLALAAVYDGESRSAAAKIGGVTLQSIRDWVVRFNAEGPDGLIDRKAPGPATRLNDDQRRALKDRVEQGPIPAAHGVVRWRLCDLAQWLYEEFGVSLDQTTVSRELKAMGYAKLSARPRHHAQNTHAMEDFKKTSRLRSTGSERKWAKA